MDKNSLTALPNIGETLSQKLITIGIDTPQKLIETGSVNTYKMLKVAGLDPCCNTLYALEGAVRGIRWHNIDRQELEVLKEKVQEL